MHRLRIPVPLTKRMIAIAVGSLLAVLFVVILLSRSGGPAKDTAAGQPAHTPTAAHPTRVIITPTPALAPTPPPPAAEPPIDEPGLKAEDTSPKARRPKPPVEPAVAPASPFEHSRVSPMPRPRPKAERRIITDI